MNSLLLLALLACAHSVAAVPADELTFTQLGAQWNATRQWILNFQRGNLDQPGFGYVDANCPSSVRDACISKTAPLMMGTGDLLKVTYALNQTRGPNGALATYKGMTPTKLSIKLCYSNASFVDRPWRKKNKAYPRLSQNCKYTFNSSVFPGTSPADFNREQINGTQVMNFNDRHTVDEVPSAQWFTMLWVYCGDQVCAFESTEGTAGPGKFVQTNVEMGITPGMKAAAIILSVFSPVFFFGFWIVDTMYYRKTGRPILLC